MKPAAQSQTVRRVGCTRLTTKWGIVQAFGFQQEICNGTRRNETAVALLLGQLRGKVPLLRIHSQCLTGDVFSSERCDCRAQLELALHMIAEERRGLVIYEHQEGRGIGLLNKLRAYELQDEGADTVEANERLGFESDLRNYELPGEILRYFGLKSIRLLSNNPEKVAAVEAAGVRVAERVPCIVPAMDSTEAYLRTKKEKMGHLFTER